MERWTSESRPGLQIGLSLAMTLVGAGLMFALRDFGTVGGDATAGFVLGAILVILGAGGVLSSAKQTVVIDPDTCCITVEDAGRFGTKRREIRFADILDVRVGYFGKSSNFVTYYYLALRLRDGEEYALFAPGRFFDGASHRATVESWRRRLEEYMRGS